MNGILSIRIIRYVFMKSSLNKDIPVYASCASFLLSKQNPYLDAKNAYLLNEPLKNIIDERDCGGETSKHEGRWHSRPRIEKHCSVQLLDM